jgi:hypothetical protein
LAAFIPAFPPISVREYFLFPSSFPFPASHSQLSILDLILDLPPIQPSTLSLYRSIHSILYFFQPVYRHPIPEFLSILKFPLIES